MEISKILQKLQALNQGSGLGLFIVKYIMNQLKGDVEVYNNNGLEVKLILPLKFKS